MRIPVVSPCVAVLISRQLRSKQLRGIHGGSQVQVKILEYACGRQDNPATQHVRKAGRKALQPLQAGVVLRQVRRHCRLIGRLDARVTSCMCDISMPGTVKLQHGKNTRSCAMSWWRRMLKMPNSVRQPRKRRTLRIQIERLVGSKM